MAFRAEKHYLIGYGSNQWKLLDLSNGRTCWARDIWIVESPAATETYEDLTEELIFPPDEESPPLPGTLPGQILDDSETSPITNSPPLPGQIGEGGIDSVENPDSMDIENPGTSFEDFMQQVFETAFITGNPVIYKQTISAEDASLWKEIMEKNLIDYKKLNIWNLMNLSFKKKIINGRWTYLIKSKKKNEKYEKKNSMNSKRFSTTIWRQLFRNLCTHD